MSIHIADIKKKHARVQALIAAAREKIETMDVGLMPKVREVRIAEVRANMTKEIGGIYAKMTEARDDAKKKLPHLSQEAARRRARFATDPALDAAQRMATLETLKRTGTGELLAHLSDAIRDGSIARAEAVRLEFSSRADNKSLTKEFTTLFSQVHDAHARAQEIECHQVIAVHALAEQQLSEFSKGFSDPVSRMTAARMVKAAEAAA